MYSDDNCDVHIPAYDSWTRQEMAYGCWLIFCPIIRFLYACFPGALSYKIVLSSSCRKNLIMITGIEDQATTLKWVRLVCTGPF